MAITVETLVTKQVLDDSQYSQAAKRVVGSTGMMGRALDGFTQNLGQLSRLGLWGAGLAAGLGAVGFKAMQAAASFDTMTRTFAGAFGSMEAGAQTMRAMESYATKSAFSLEALARAGVTLAAGGLDLKTYLPVLERFALVISGVDPQGLQQVAGALLRAKGGGFGEAMEIFRRAGVGAGEFRGAGVAINKGGEVQATAEQFLAALVSISEGKLKTMADNISGGAETTISNTFDVLGQAFRAIGEELNAAFLPSFQEFTDRVRYIVESGVVKDIADGMIGLVTSMTGQGGLKSAVDQVSVALLAIPGIMKGLQEVFGSLWNMGAGPKVESALNWLSRSTGAGSSIGDVLKEFYGINAAQAKFDAAKGVDKSYPEFAPSPRDGGYLPQIARNTERAAAAQERALDLQRSIVGGGQVGQGALSPANLSRAKGAGHPGSKIQAAVDLIQEALLDAIRENNRLNLQGGR